MGSGPKLGVPLRGPCNMDSKNILESILGSAYGGILPIQRVDLFEFHSFDLRKIPFVFHWPRSNARLKIFWIRVLPVRSGTLASIQRSGRHITIRGI